MNRLCLALLLTLLGSRADATLIFDQPPSPGGGVLISSWVFPDGTDYDNFVYDSFQLGSSEAITEVRWRGGYFYTGYGMVNNFSITFYESIAGGSQPQCGLPGDGDTYLATYVVGGNAGETPAGVYGGTQMYDYHFTLPQAFLAAANVKYWIQIEGYTAGLPFWGVSIGTGGNNSHFEYSRGAHQFSTRVNDASFSLHTTAGPTYTIATSGSPVEGGATAGDGAYPPSTTATVVATANPGWGFLNWTENGIQVSTSPSYSFTVNANRTLVAHFTPAYTVATSAQPIWGGTTAGGGVYNSGSNVTVVATPVIGFDFVNWTENGVQVSASPSYAFAATSNRDLVANFLLGAESVLFDLDSAEPQVYPTQMLPATQTTRGLTASFFAPVGPWSVQSDGTTQWHLSQFYANYFYPNGSGHTLEVKFSKPLILASLDFCTADFQQVEVPTSVRLTAYTDSTKSTQVGSATAHGTYGGDTMPMGTVTFSSTEAFRYIEISTVYQPLGSNVFLADNLLVTTVSPTDVPGEDLPQGRLLAVAPNPTRGETQLSFEMPAAGAARITVYDLAGRRVREVATGVMQPGRNIAIWDGKDGRGQAVPTGVYYVRLDAPGDRRTRRLVVIH